jgi:hypothetical protein
LIDNFVLNSASICSKMNKGWLELESDPGKQAIYHSHIYEKIRQVCLPTYSNNEGIFSHIQPTCFYLHLLAMSPRVRLVFSSNISTVVRGS